MSRKAKWIVFAVALLVAVLLAAAGALPYGYIIQAFLVTVGDGAISAAWALYVFVMALLALALWRMLYMAVERRPRR